MTLLNKKNANWETENVSLCQVTHKCLHEYIHRERCRKLHCQMSECSKDLFLAHGVLCMLLSTFLYLIFLHELVHRMQILSL